MLRRKKTRGGGRRKYTVSTARLKDKKINSLIESRMQQIAQREDQKLIEYYIERLSYLGPGQQWPNTDTWPATVDSFGLAAGNMYYRQLANVGGFLATDLAGTTNVSIGPPDLQCNLLLKRIGFHGRFLNQGLCRSTVDVSLWRVPFDKAYLASRGHTGQQIASRMDKPAPHNNWIEPFTLFNTASSECKRMFRESKRVAGGTFAHPNPRNVQRIRIAHARFSLPVFRQVDAGGGANNRQNTEPWVTRHCIKTYKGAGRKESYEFESILGPDVLTTIGAPSKNIYYFTIMSDQTLIFQGVSTVRFARADADPSQLVFSGAAPGAQ